MAKAQLDQDLLEKLAGKTRKTKQYVREQISRRASRNGISSQATEIIWAREYGIGTGRFLRSLPPHIQQQVRDGIPPPGRSNRAPRADSDTKAAKGRALDPVRGAIDHLLSDAELKKRCSDILKGRGPYDRVVREATTILDHLLKKLGGITGYMNPGDVVGKVLNPQKPILKVSDELAEREGMFSICRGLALAFRGPAHHALRDDSTRTNALKFCGFVDTLLAVLDKAERAP